jgi:endonuclease/exonuclease/phosphatase family metal-dependent hydrolase
MMNYAHLVAILLAGFALSCASPRKESEPIRLRVLSYNIHHGEGTDGKLDLERIAQVIRAAQPDLVALQEVDDRAHRTGSVNQPAELARLTGLIGNFGQAMALEGGGYGQTVLSRWPVLSRTVHTLPQRPGREPRIALVVQTKAGARGPEINFASTHFDHEFEAIRLQQAATLNGVLSSNSIPTILAGDFNAVPESAEMRIFLSDWLDTAESNPQPTIPSDQPQRRIDYILARPRNDWRVIEARVLEEAVASDHRALLSVVEWIGN